MDKKKRPTYPIPEERFQEIKRLFEKWIIEGPDKSSVTFSKASGRIMCKGQLFNGTPEEVLGEMMK